MGPGLSAARKSGERWAAAMLLALRSGASFPRAGRLRLGAKASAVIVKELTFVNWDGSAAMQFGQEGVHAWWAVLSGADFDVIPE